MNVPVHKGRIVQARVVFFSFLKNAKTRLPREVCDGLQKKIAGYEEEAEEKVEIKYVCVVFAL